VSSGKKIHARAILIENMANYISLERVINVDFRKNIICRIFFNSAKENCKNDGENDMRHSIKQMN